MKAYSYIRFSTPEQRHGFSFDRQSEGSVRLCQKHGWKLDDSVRLHDLGRSGFHGHQIVLKAFIKAIEAGEVTTPSVLIVEKLDRLSREDIDDAYQLWRTILKHGVLIATVEPERLYDRKSLNKITDIMEALLHFMVAHEESQKKSDRALDNWERKRKNADDTGEPITGKRPAWLTPEFRIIDDKAEVIRLIFRMAIDGHGARSIQTHLNTSGIPNIALGYSKKSKVKWNLRYVEAILQDKKTFGEHQIYTGNIRNRIPQGPPKQGYFPAIITEKTFYEAQAARKSRIRQRGPTGRDIANIFQGLLIDGNGDNFILQQSSKMDKAKGIDRRLAVNGQSVPACLFESCFLNGLREIDHKLMESTEDPLPALESKLADLDDRLADLMAILKTRKYATGVELQADLDSQREAVLAEIETAKTAVVIDPKSIVRAMDQLEKAKDKEPLRRKIKSLLRQIIKQIVLQITNVDGNRLHKKWHISVNFHQQFKVTMMDFETYKGVVTTQRIRGYTGWPAEQAHENETSWKPSKRQATTAT